MDLSFYATHTAQEILSSFDVSVGTGLSSQQINKLQKRYGLNVLVRHEVTWLHVLVRQFKSPFFYLLTVAAIFSFFLGEILSASMIILFTMVNIALGFYQEYHAEHTIKMLQNLIMPKTNVRRNGEIFTIQTRELVPGDIIFLEPGDIIPADIRFILADDVTVDEAVLTGESVPVIKKVEPITETQDILRSINLGFSGTVLSTGKATGVVVATGSNTIFGSIARIAQQTQRESIFTHEIRKFGSFMLLMIIITFSVIFAVHIFVKGTSIPFTDLALFIVALIVTIIPEALPVVISFCLARGAVQMSRNHVIVRRLSAIEDLGSIEVLCADKTGTLTANNLAVVDVYGERDKVLVQAAYTNSLMPGQDKAELYSFDGALINAINTENISIASATRVQYLPYDQALWCVHALVESSGGYDLIIRGAFEKVVERCSSVEPGSKNDVITWVHDQGIQGHRILAVARKHIPIVLSGKEMAQQQDFTLLGMVAFADPIKSTAPLAISKAKKLGITVKIITGDALEVAGAVAQQIGLIQDCNEVITGTQLDSMSEHEQIQAIDKYAVFARISPMQKFFIVKKLQENHNVGFLGEGVNDAPALKLAHVALVVENGADVAKDAADIILLKKSLHVIVDGVEEGRKVFLNTVKYLNVVLASNFSNFYTMAFISLCIDFLPMLPLQILLVNLLSDFPLISIASDHVNHDDLQRPQNFNFRQIIGRATFFGVVCSGFDLLFFLLFFHRSPALIQTTWFMFSILTELVFFYSVRSRRFFIFAGLPSLTIMGLSLVSCVIACWVPLTYFGQMVFKFVPPNLFDYGTIMGLVVLFFIAIEVVKYLYYRWIGSHAHS